MGFHLSLYMGYVDNALYFCMATEAVSDLVNKSISQRYKAHEHSLEMADKVRAAEDSGALESQADNSWEHLPAEQRSAATEKIDV